MNLIRKIALNIQIACLKSDIYYLQQDMIENGVCYQNAKELNVLQMRLKVLEEKLNRL